MYGLVNLGVRDMVVDAGGEELWTQVRTKAGILDDDFQSMQSYDDSVTMSLVNAASETLSTPADVLLRGFGYHWIGYTSREGYGPLLDVTGASLVEFLNNLDRMHARIAISMPELHPPVFSCRQLDHDVLEIEYTSTREGLAPMVIGLLEGLAERFNERVVVTQTQVRPAPDAPDVFEVRFEDRSN